jgi:uncharacterized protein GlcG (DUF336 family)
MRVSRWLAAGALTAVAACGGGGGSGGGAAGPAPSTAFLAEAEVQRIVAQAVAEAQARGARAHVAVVDRAGNVLAAFAMSGAPATVAITSGSGVTGGLDGIAQGTVPAAYSATAKAMTAAYLSSNGNAFSTRTANQIVREHFDPSERGQPSGPLYGVQYSQLPCSDVNRRAEEGTQGPKRSPLGMSADPGGLPLYKDGVLVGGIGIEANGVYGGDADIVDIDGDPEEAIAVAGAFGYAAPQDIRANRITADGRTLRYVDSEALASTPAAAPAFAALPGALVAIPGFASGAVSAGTVFGSVASGVRAASRAELGADAFVLVDALGNERFAPRDAPDRGLEAAQVTAILAEALAVARRARAQIRRPLGSAAQVSVAVVDVAGNVLGIARTADGPMFGIDVAVQKARTAALFSGPLATGLFVGSADHLPNGAHVDLADYLAAARAFLGDANAFTGATAWSARAIGNIHRPMFPDGIDGAPQGPLSTPMGRWSPFNVGYQLDLVYDRLLASASRPLDHVPCVAPAAGPSLANGAQIFPGGVPIYRGSVVVGAIGVSGDGVDQDDMVAFLGLDNAAARVGNAIGNAPPAMRADRLTPMGTRLRYVQCPQSPFLDSSEQDACAGK